MKTYEVKSEIECQLRHRNNYVQNNAINICKKALRIDSLDSEKILSIKNLKKLIEEAENPWQWSGNPDIEKTKIIQAYLVILLILLD